MTGATLLQMSPAKPSCSGHYFTSMCAMVVPSKKKQGRPFCSAARVRYFHSVINYCVCYYKISYFFSRGTLVLVRTKPAVPIFNITFHVAST